MKIQHYGTSFCDDASDAYGSPFGVIHGGLLLHDWSSVAL
jgi:hypothetical protein